MGKGKNFVKFFPFPFPPPLPFSKLWVENRYYPFIFLPITYKKAFVLIA